MAPLKADNDTWSARLGGEATPGHRTVVFFCTSNGQRPYRVAEVPKDRFTGQDDLDSLPEDELRILFESTTSMGAPRSFD